MFLLFLRIGENLRAILYQIVFGDKNMRNFLFFVFLFTQMPTPAFADPITILGISWSRDAKDNMQLLSDAGYSCGPYNGSLGIGDVCVKGHEEIIFQSEQISFNCFVFNMCEYSIQQAAQLFVDTTNVPTMELKNNYTTTGKLWLKACGQGEDGDKVCMSPHMLAVGLGHDVGQSFYSLELIKGAYGKRVGFK